MFRSIVLLALLLPVANARAGQPTSGTTKTVRLLTVGNSFSQNATRYLGDLVEAKGHTLIHRPLVIGGASMEVHWNKAQLHEKDPKDPKGLYGTKSLRQELMSDTWDYVTIQQASIKSHDVATYRPFAKELHDFIKKAAPMAEILVHQTWAYRIDDPRFTRPSKTPGEPATQKEMYDGLTRAYQTIAGELGLRVIPVGDAIYLADTNAQWGYRPDKKFDFKNAAPPALPDQTHSLHTGWRWGAAKGAKKSLTMDGHHASAAGQYLAACAFYEVLFGESVVGNSFVPKEIDRDYARFLQETAHQAVAHGKEPNPPAGFRAIFNGKDLTGWYGLNPHNGAKLKGDKKEANLKQQRADYSKHWRIENGELVNDGTGPYAATDAEFGDIELRLEYKTVPKADSGIYLRGTPQVQIWDWNQVFNPKNPTRKPHLGSGGLFNNTPGSPGRDPLVRADKPFGEWNQFRIRQVGARTWVWLNGKPVVDGAIMENYWDRAKPLPAKGPIMLQTHGGEIRWRNLFVRAIDAKEANEIINAADSDAKARLSQALTLHVSFDKGLDADFSRGDKTCYLPQGKTLVPAKPNDELKLAAAGRFGKALHFPKKGSFRPSFKDGGTLGYNAKSWSASVSAWLRLDPDKDLAPGYCDPIQIIGDDNKKGYIFLEWSKDETPRFFRYAIRPLFPIWNPKNQPWADIPADKKPMVEVARAPFSRDKWTHVVFTLENIIDQSKPPIGRLYLNGKLQGAIENWKMTFDWDPAKVLLVLGANYVGYMDDLAVFDRPLTDVEVDRVYGLKTGIRELYP